MFKALLLEKDESGFRAGVRAGRRSRLPEGDVACARRALDAQLQGRPRDHQPQAPVVRSWPMVAGIDGAGTVLE